MFVYPCVCKDVRGCRAEGVCTWICLEEGTAGSAFRHGLLHRTSLLVKVVPLVWGSGLIKKKMVLGEVILKNTHLQNSNLSFQLRASKFFCLFHFL